MRKKYNSLFLILILLFMLVAIVTSLSFEHFETMLVPLIISCAAFILAAVELYRDLRIKVKTGSEDEMSSESVAARGELKALGLAIGWLLVFLLVIFVVGFFIAILVFAFCYMKLHRRGWLSSSVFAVALTLITYLIFEFGLKAQLYRGLIFS